MSVSDQRRREMHLGLRTSLGDDVADTLMEHLPHGGWSDVARKGDTDELSVRVGALSDRVTTVEQRLDGVERRLDGVEYKLSLLDMRFESIDRRMTSMERHIDILDGRTKIMIAALIAVGVALFGSQIQILLRLAQM